MDDTSTLGTPHQRRQTPAVVPARQAPVDVYGVSMVAVVCLYMIFAVHNVLLPLFPARHDMHRII